MVDEIQSSNGDDGDDGSEACESVRFHIPHPSVKVMKSSSDDGDLTNPNPDNHIRVGLFTMGQLIFAYDASRINEDDYNVANYNCANLVLDMLCNLEADLSMEEYMTWASLKVSKNPRVQQLVKGGCCRLGS